MSTVTRRIFALASLIEPDPSETWQWFMSTPLPGTGDQTACELLFAGKGERVIVFLRRALAAHLAGSRVVPFPSAWRQAVQEWAPHPPIRNATRRTVRAPRYRDDLS